MNLKETFALNEQHGKNRMPLNIAKQFWAEQQDKVLKDDALIEKTFSGIKLVESLVKRDAEGKHFKPEELSIRFVTKTAPKAEGQKVSPYTLWIELLDKDGKTVYSMTYRDAVSGTSIVKDAEGKNLIEGKGWKKIRDYFKTEKPVEAKPKTEKVKAEKAEKPAKVKKAAKKAPKTEAPVVEVKPVEQIPVVAPATKGEDGIEMPEIPEELM